MNLMLMNLEHVLRKDYESLKGHMLRLPITFLLSTNIAVSNLILI